MQGQGGGACDRGEWTRGGEVWACGGSAGGLRWDSRDGPEKGRLNERLEYEEEPARPIRELGSKVVSSSRAGRGASGQRDKRGRFDSVADHRAGQRQSMSSRPLSEI